MKKCSVALSVLMISLFVTACGGGGASSGPLFTVGGVVSGLTGTLVLQNNGGDDLTIAADGRFTFPTALAPGISYAVTVRTNPAGQTCLVSKGTGAILILNVTGITVDCFRRGGLDVTFNSHGFAVQSNVTGSNADDSGNAVAVDSQGRILVTGSSGTNSAGNTDMVVWRYNADGTLDTTFNNSGFVVQDSPAGANADDSGNAVAIYSEDRILITGSSGTTGNKDMVVWRYNADGTLDTTFNFPNGFVMHSNAAAGTGDDSGNAVAIDSRKILVAGSSTNSAGNTDMVVWKFNANGTVDTDFGGGEGFVVHNNAAGGYGNDFGKAVVIDFQERILVAGTSTNISGNTDMVLWRFTSDGTLDTTFNSPNGFIVHSNAAGTGNDSGNAVAIDSQGRILVAGSSTNSSGDTDMVLWRFTQNGTLDTAFGGDGIVIDNGAAGSNGNDSGNAVAVDSQGRILVAGSSTNGANTDMVVWRFEAAGALDITFAADGVAVHDNAAGGNGDDSGSAVAIGFQDRILVAGSSRNSAGNSDMVIWSIFP